MKPDVILTSDLTRGMIFRTNIKNGRGDVIYYRVEEVVGDEVRFWGSSGGSWFASLDREPPYHCTVQEFQERVIREAHDGEVEKAPSADDYLRAADLLEQLTEDQCHPALFTIRERYAARLRGMSTYPEHPFHVNAFGTLYIFVYTRPFFFGIKGSDWD